MQWLYVKALRISSLHSLATPKWKEIQYFLEMIPGQKAEDRPDIVVRVFKIKLDQLMKDLMHGKHFGRVRAGNIFNNN